MYHQRALTVLYPEALVLVLPKALSGPQALVLVLCVLSACPELREGMKQLTFWRTCPAEVPL